MMQLLGVLLTETIRIYHAFQLRRAVRMEVKAKRLWDRYYPVWYAFQQK